MSERSKNKKDFLYRINEFPDVKASPDFHERLYKKIDLIKSGKMKMTEEDDFLYRMKDFPDIKASSDFLDRLHKKIEINKSGIESGNVQITNKTFGEKLKEFLEKYSRPYLVPAFGLLVLAAIIYYFAVKNSADENKNIITEKTKEQFENKNPVNIPSEKPPSILSDNDQKKLDSMFNDQKKNLDKTTKEIEKSVKYLAEDNGKNINKIFTGLNKNKSGNKDTLQVSDIKKAGIGIDIDSNFYKQLDKITRDILDSLSREVNR